MFLLILLLLPQATPFHLLRPRHHVQSRLSSTQDAAGTLDAALPTRWTLSQPLLPAYVSLLPHTTSNTFLPLLSNLIITTPALNLYSVDLLASCEYLPLELEECSSSTCEIYPLDLDIEDEYPTIYKQDAAEFGFRLDGWARMDMPTDDYYSITEYTESFTGYEGKEIWGMIHEKIQFQDKFQGDDAWRYDFNKIVSGLHTSINAHILQDMDSKRSAGDPTVADLDLDAEFTRRLGVDSELPYISNLYFTYMILLTALKQATPRLLADCENGLILAPGLPKILKHEILDLENNKVSADILVRHAQSDVRALWKARMRIRELMRAMNCVQCSKCRLHGKIATLGISTAMQILLGNEACGGDPMALKRVELASLIATISKFANAVEYVERKLAEQTPTT